MTLGTTKVLVKIPEQNQPPSSGVTQGRNQTRNYTKLKYLLISLWFVAIIASGYFILNYYVFTESPIKIDPPVVEDTKDIEVPTETPFSVKVESSTQVEPGSVPVKITIEDKNAGVEDLKNYHVSLKISGGRDSKEIPVFSVNSPDPRQKINFTTSTNKIELNTTISLLSPGRKNIQARIVRPRDKKETIHSTNLTVRDIPPPPPPPPLKPPLPVIAYGATNITQTGFTANWSTSTANTGYRIDVSTNNNFTSFVGGYNNLDVGNVNSRSVSGLDPGTTYYYRVRAYNNIAVSDHSNTINLTTAFRPPPPPVEDEEIDASPNFVRIKWDNTGLILSIKSTQDKPYEVENFSGKNTTAVFKEISNSNYEIIFNNLNDIPPIIEIKIKGFKRPIRVQK